MEIDCPYTTLWITAQDNDWDHFYVHAATEHPKDGAEWVGFFRDAHGMEGFLRGMQTANDKMLAELSYTKGENAKLRAELAEAKRIIKYIDTCSSSDARYRIDEKDYCVTCHAVETELRAKISKMEAQRLLISVLEDDVEKVMAERNELLDMLVNLYDLGNLDDEWMGKVAMILAKNDK